MWLRGDQGPSPVLELCHWSTRRSRYRLTTAGRRAFSCVGPSAWNSLPEYLTVDTLTLDYFKQSLKCFLFARYWHSTWSALGIRNDSVLYKCTLNNNYYYKDGWFSLVFCITELSSYKDFSGRLRGHRVMMVVLWWLWYQCFWVFWSLLSTVCGKRAMCGFNTWHCHEERHASHKIDIFFLWHQLLPYRYSYKAPCARQG